MKTKKKVSKKKTARRASKPKAPPIVLDVPTVNPSPKMAKVKILCDLCGHYDFHATNGTEVLLPEEKVAHLLLARDNYRAAQKELHALYVA